MENLLKIAKASKSDGTDGAVVFSFLSIAPEDLEISEPVFVHFDGLPVPFFIESFSRKGTSKAVVHLNDIRSYEDAEELVGKDIYEKLIKGYTEKQWGRKCTELPAFIIKRLPVRMVFDNNYFNDRYQGIPIGGYNKLIDGLLEGSLTTEYTGKASQISSFSRAR